MAKIFLATSASTDLGQTWDRPYPKWLYLLLDFWMQRQGCQKIHPVSIGFELRQGRAIVCHRPIDFGEASAPAFGHQWCAQDNTQAISTRHRIVVSSTRALIGSEWFESPIFTKGNGPHPRPRAGVWGLDGL